MASKGIAFVTTLLAPIDVSPVKDNKFEPRAEMDLRFRIPWTKDDPGQGFINTSVIESTVINAGGLTIGPSTITVDAS